MIERNPVLFWQTLTIILAGTVLILLALRAVGR